MNVRVDTSAWLLEGEKPTVRGLIRSHD